MQHNTSSVHTGKQEPSGPGHRTHNTTHRAGTLMNRSQKAQDTARATQNTKRAHQRIGAKLPGTPHLQHNTPSGHTGEQERSGPGHHRCNKTNQASTPVNRSQVAQETVDATHHTKRAHRSTGAKWPRTPHTQHNTPRRGTGKQEPSCPGQGTRKPTDGAGTPREQEPSGPGHHTRNTTQRAGTPVRGGQVAQETARATQHTERAHR